MQFRTPGFERQEFDIDGEGSIILDSFPQTPDAACCFLRLHSGKARNVRFSVPGAYRLASGHSGGWMLIPSDPATPAYWLTQPPILRKQDKLGHILSEDKVSLTGFNATSNEISIDLRIPDGWHMDWVFWRFGASAARLAQGLEHTCALEKRPYFLWGSKVNFTLPAGGYQYLINGKVYTNDFVWPRNWKFHSELDAYGLYLALGGLEQATGKTLYSLMKRQMLYSVISAQSEDGGWHQGEWTDLMESHYRLHNAAMLMLASGLEEFGDEAIRHSLSRAAQFLSACTDQTRIGYWFLHDSLEDSVESMEEMRRQTNTPWIATRTFGKSPTNKLILNTHLDAIVALERYRDATGDEQYGELIASARGAARALLTMRPAEWLYRQLYKAIRLTLLPRQEAMRLPLPLRMFKRLTWQYLTPNMHRAKRVFPRLVMPGGLIERHIAPMHYDINYHPVNVMDLARFGRRFPDEDLAGILDEAIKAVADTSLLTYWAEAKPRQFAVVEWADALYHLCTLDKDLSLRAHLGKTLLLIHDLGQGLPPSLLGSDREATGHTQRTPCPSPSDERLIVANLSHHQEMEILVVNPADSGLELAWESPITGKLSWLDSNGSSLGESEASPTIPARSWIVGKASTPAKYHSGTT
jgi:hypothetical protein